MADRFVPLAPRIGARAVVRRDEVLASAFADECLDALEQLRRPRVPPDRSQRRRAGLSSARTSARSSPWDPCVRTAPRRSCSRSRSILARTRWAAEYLKSTIGWHIDGLHDEGPPPKATMLSARRLSPTGGQTEFCSTYAAYEDLPEDEQKRCESLRVVHTLEASKRNTNPNATPEELARTARAKTARRSTRSSGTTTRDASRSSSA